MSKKTQNYSSQARMFCVAKMPQNYQYMIVCQKQHGISPLLLSYFCDIYDTYSATTLSGPFERSHPPASGTTSSADTAFGGNGCFWQEQYFLVPNGNKLIVYQGPEPN